MEAALLGTQQALAKVLTAARNSAAKSPPATDPIDGNVSSSSLLCAQGTFLSSCEHNAPGTPLAGRRRQGRAVMQVHAVWITLV